MSVHVALLRGINVSGRNAVPMAGLREACAGLGWTAVQTYIQSGNVVFRARGATANLESLLERTLAQQFRVPVPVLVRTAAQWAACLAANPFGEAAEREPSRVMLALSKLPPKAGAAAALQDRATLGERVLEAGGALWIHYPAGMGKSKLTPALLDRFAGSPVTTRNWRTVLEVAARAAGAHGPGEA